MPTSVGAERPERADLGRRLERRAGDGEVDALVQVESRAHPRRRAGARAAPGRRRRAGWGSAGRAPSSFGPISGLKPIRLMWSVRQTRLPGPASGRSEPAAFVSTSVSAPSSRSVRIGVVIAEPAIPSYTCARPAKIATGTPASRPSTSAPGVARRARRRGTRAARRRGSPRGRRAASASSPRPEPSIRPSRGAKPGERSAMAAAAVTRRRCCGPKESGSSSPSVTSCGGRRSRSTRWIGASSAANSRSRWRQPPHGLHSSGARPARRPRRSRPPPPATRAPIADASAHWPCGYAAFSTLAPA